MEVATQEIPVPVTGETAPPEPVIPELEAPDEESKPEPISFEDWFAKLDSDPDLKSAYDEHSKEKEKEISVAEYRKLQSHLQPVLDRLSQNSQQTRDTLGKMWNGLQKAVGDGNLEPESIAELLQSNKSALDAFNSQLWWEGTFYTLNSLGKVIEDDMLGNEFLARLWQMATNNRPDPEFANALLSRLTDWTVS